MTFWLGLHMPTHLPLAGVPSCVSFGRLRKRRRLPDPAAPVFLDSRGFSEISQHGRYTFTPAEYAAFVRRARDQWGGRLAHASIMDLMCEPPMLVKTGKSIPEHQRLTVESWLTLNGIDESLPWVPVLQGWKCEDYHDCLDLYERAGVRLASLPLVGLGSVCRRQGTREAAGIVKSLYARGLKNLHGFGFKTAGLVSRRLRLACYLKSSDSMAWSFQGRAFAWRHEELRLCGGDHKGGCGNCLDWALTWRDRLCRRVEQVTRGGTQELLF